MHKEIDIIKVNDALIDGQRIKTGRNGYKISENDDIFVRDKHLNGYFTHRLETFCKRMCFDDGSSSLCDH